MGKFLKGRTVPPEIGRKISKALTGQKRSAEFKAKISRATKGEHNPFWGKRHTPEARKLMGERRRFSITKDQLVDLYVNQRMPTPQIASLLSISVQAVCDHLEYHGIPRRSRREALKGLKKPYTKTPKVLADWEKRREFNLTRGYLEWLYKGCGLATIEIAILYGVCRQTVCGRLKQTGIPLIPQLGPRNGHWKGGFCTTPYPKAWTPELKEAAKMKDGYICQMCYNCRFSPKLHVHHIDFDKHNLDPKNLISLCPSHHMMVNAKRGKLIQKWLALINDPDALKALADETMCQWGASSEPLA